jgi:hypothetical protein
VQEDAILKLYEVVEELSQYPAVKDAALQLLTERAWRAKWHFDKVMEAKP